MAVRTFQTGDVVWSPDPYHTDDPELTGDGAPRPWVILSTTQYPNQGADYIACALTSNMRPEPDTVPLVRRDWAEGGSPKPSQIDPQTLMTLKHRWLRRYLGRLRDDKVNLARRRVRSYL